MFSQIKENILNRIFYSVAGVMPQGWDIEVLGGRGGVKNFSMGICDGAPSTAHSSYFCCILFHLLIGCTKSVRLVCSLDGRRSS